MPLQSKQHEQSCIKREHVLGLKNRPVHTNRRFLEKLMPQEYRDNILTFNTDVANIQKQTYLNTCKTDSTVTL